MDSVTGSTACEASRPDGDVNVIVMSDSGKPIFALHALSEETLTHICGLLQAVRSSILHSDLDLGELQSLQSGSMHVVFMTVGAISLVAMSTIRLPGEAFETEACLRLQLEYVYAKILFSLTDQVQAIFAQNASFDLRSMLGNDSSMRAILCEARPEGNPAPFFTAGVQTVFPLSHAVRERTSAILKQIGDQTANAVAALLFVGNKLVSAVQSSYRPHQLRAADLHLVFEFITRQQLQSELWLPLCLPRFNSSGFLHCYAHCLDPRTKLTLALISQDGSTEQFQAFRTAAVRIRRCLSIPVENRNILEILSPSPDSQVVSSEDCEGGNDIQWRRSLADTCNYFEDDSYEMISYDAVDHGGSCQLLPELTAASSEEVAAKFAEYHDLGVLHFVFRLDVPIQADRKKSSKRRNDHSPGHLTQCVSPPLDDPFVDAASKRRVWCAYQRLQLRLRLGSANAESVHDVFRMIVDDDDNNNVARIAPTVGKHCPAMGLAESPPNMQGVTYMTYGSETFLAINGRGFELYVREYRGFLFAATLARSLFNAALYLPCPAISSLIMHTQFNRLQLSEQN